jgi:hypothetical protein
MRRLRRWIWYAALTASLLVAAGSAWAMFSLPNRDRLTSLISPRGYISLTRSTRSEALEIAMDGDGLSFERDAGIPVTAESDRWQFRLHAGGLGDPHRTLPIAPVQTRRWLDTAGLRLSTGRFLDRSMRPAQWYIDARVPHWLIITLAAALPLRTALSLTLRRHSFVPGHCPTCGYDLRATPNRCPECGTEITCSAPGDVTA